MSELSLKQEVEEVDAAFSENFNKQNAAGIAALYARDGMLVSVTGQHTDIAQAYQSLFEAGFDHDEQSVVEIWPLGADTLLVLGEYRLTGKNESGAPIEVGGIYTAIYIREDGAWKIRMLTAIRQ